MKIFLPALMTVLLSVLSLDAQKVDKFDWKQGRVLGSTHKFGLETTEGPNMAARNPSESTSTSFARNDEETFSIEGGENIYIVKRGLYFIWHKRIDLEDKTTVKYAVRKGKFYIQDRKGKKVTYEIVETKTAPE